MDFQAVVQILTSVIAAGAAVTSVVLGTRLQKANELNLKLRDSLNTKKMSLYQELFSLLDDLIDGKYDRDDNNYDELRELIQGKFKEAAYYASPEVVKSLGDLMQHYYTNDDPEIHVLRGRKLFAEMVVQIRKDLGHDTTLTRKESWLDILRFSIKDISDYIPAKKRNDRGKKTKPVMIVNSKEIK
jgi:hypothetical protein